MNSKRGLDVTQKLHDPLHFFHFPATSHHPHSLIPSALLQHFQKSFIPATGILRIPSSTPFDFPVIQHSPYPHRLFSQSSGSSCHSSTAGHLSHHQAARSIKATTSRIDPRVSVLARYRQRVALPQHRVNLHQFNSGHQHSTQSHR